MKKAWHLPGFLVFEALSVHSCDPANAVMDCPAILQTTRPVGCE